MTGAALEGAGFLARAWRLADEGRDRTRPNPLVGCVIERDGTIVGEGFHERAGGPHAEIVALAAAGERARGATAWVTLEPCDHHGRTGPCSVALLEAGVARVVIGMRDPHRVAAGGAKRLADSGVEVVDAGWETWIRAQNEVFLTAIEKGRPWLTLKIAATRNGDMVVEEKWITGIEARTEVHRLRSHADHVLVGSGTVEEDDPRLDVRHVAVTGVAPTPLILDRRGRSNPAARAIIDGTVVVAGPDATQDWITKVEARGAEVILVDGGIDAQLRAVASRGAQRILAEPGPTLATALVSADLVDEVVLHHPSGTGALRLPGPLRGHRWHHVRTRPLGPDVETVLRPAED